MKRILIAITLYALFPAVLFARHISQEEAMLVAENFMNAAPASGSRHAAPPKKMALKQAAEENQFYVYENEDGEGWVVVAANDAVTPILAYSETGHFLTSELPVNVRGWMEKYNTFIKRIEAEGISPSEEATGKWNALRQGVRRSKGDAVVGPLIKTQWDQDAPYNNLCPGTGSDKSYAGCVAIAMAQIMKYWEWPKQGTGSHSYQPLDPASSTGGASKRYGVQSAEFGSTTYDWANMLNSYSGNYTDTEANAIATLMYHCGVAVEMMYGNDDDGGSGAFTVNYGDSTDFACAQNAFVNYFGYKKDGLTGYMRNGVSEQGTQIYQSWSDAAWTAMIKGELDKLHPIMYGGSSENSGGLEFVCDGYDDAGYFHFNWGWAGDCDGYYLLSNLAPNAATGGGTYNFSEDQEVIIGIVPVRGDTTGSVEPTDTTTVVQERQSTFLNFSDVQSIDDWTITNATLNETETTMYDYLETYVYDIYSNIPGVAYVTDMPDITFTMESTSDKTKAFYVGINRGYYGFYQTGGKNGIITIKNTRPYDIITLEVAAKGATAADFTDPKGQFPINAVAMTSDLVLPAKNSGAEGEDDSGYTYRTLVYYSTGGDVQIKECTAGFRLRTLSVEPGEGPTITVMGQEIPTDTTGVIDIYGDSTLIYDTEENTLTLNNLNLEVGEDESAAISYSGMEPLTIVLNDSSTIVADTVIYSAADIVITGDGHLAAEGVTPITGSPAASITFEAVNMHVRSLPSSAAVRRRIKGGKRLDETGGPALSGFGSADFNKTNVSPSGAEYGVVTTTDGSGNQTTTNALYTTNANGEQEVVTEFELTASTTAVESIRTAQPFDPSQPMYNILGLPVDAAYKGLVIQNGQTFILK